jgi:hypothetical protein
MKDTPRIVGKREQNPPAERILKIFVELLGSVQKN